MIERLPASYFTTARVPAPKQFAEWRENHRLLFDVLPIGGVPPGAFAAEATTYQIGSLLFGQTSYAASRFERDDRKVTEGLDAILIRLNLEGEHNGTAGGKPVAVQPGEIDIIDMARPIAYESTGSTVIVLCIPGPILEPVIPNRAALHGLVFPTSSGVGALLGDYLRSLIARAAEMDASEAAGVASATVALSATCLRALVDRSEGRVNVPGGALLAAIKEHIEERLRSDDLSIESLCSAFGLSRAALYRAFAPLGGVRRYIRDRRLVAAFVALADCSKPFESIAKIAFDLKFASEAHFGRVFRAAFGCTPGQTRNLEQIVRVSQAGGGQQLGTEPVYIDWAQAPRRPRPLRRLGNDPVRRG